MLKGSCLCKEVAFEIDATLDHCRYCHCKSCRKFSGTGQAAWGVVRADSFRLTTSTDSVRKYDSGGGKRVFCGCCGSPLWYEPGSMPDIIGVALGAIDDGEVAAPSMHVWTQSSPAWETIAGELPQHETHP
jgi:hypothetical protein